MKTMLRNALIGLALLIPGVAMAAADIVVHRDPGCGCCAKWAALVRGHFGRRVTIVDDAQRQAFMKRAGVPADLASCHTAVVDGLIFEGHVPRADMKRLLTQRPRGVRGLAVAGMPLGSSGMEAPGRKADAYEVIAFGPGGRRVYARHGG